MRGAVSGKRITDEVMTYILFCWGRIHLQSPVRLQFMSILCTARYVKEVLNKLNIIESLSLHLEEILLHLASSSEERLVGVLEVVWITAPSSWCCCMYWTLFVTATCALTARARVHQTMIRLEALSIRIYIYVYIYVYTYTYIYIYVYVYLQVYIHTYIHTYEYIHIHMYMYISSSILYSQ